MVGDDEGHGRPPIMIASLHSPMVSLPAKAKRGLGLGPCSLLVQEK